MHKATQAYVQTQVTTTTQADILILLYEGAIKFLHMAKEKIEQRDVKEKGMLITRALDIVNELQCSLNKEKGGELAENLNKLYFYCNSRLLMANLKMQTEPIDEVVNILDGLRSAFVQVKLDNPHLSNEVAIPKGNSNGNMGSSTAALNATRNAIMAKATASVGARAYGAAMGSTAAKQTAPAAETASVTPISAAASAQQAANDPANDSANAAGQNAAPVPEQPAAQPAAQPDPQAQPVVQEVPKPQQPQAAPAPAAPKPQAVPNPAAQQGAKPAGPRPVPKAAPKPGAPAAGPRPVAAPRPGQSAGPRPLTNPYAKAPQPAGPLGGGKAAPSNGSARPSLLGRGNGTLNNGA